MVSASDLGPEGREFEPWPVHPRSQQLSSKWSHLRVLSIESKVSKLCITQGFTLEVSGLSRCEDILPDRKFKGKKYSHVSR